MKALKKYAAECLGTFVLVFFACGAAVVTKCSTENYAGYLLTALAFGLVIVGMAYSVGNVSGCHINPAVSLAMLITKKLSLRDFIGYVLAQFIGAIAGAALLMAFVGKDSGLKDGALWYFAFADEDHCANWSYHDEWTGDSYRNVTGTDYQYISDMVIQH